MPCMYDGPEVQQAEARRELDKLTRMLCNACRVLEEHGLHQQMEGEVKDWWKNHKLEDKKREQQAVLRAKKVAMKEIEELRRLSSKYPNVKL